MKTYVLIDGLDGDVERLVTVGESDRCDADGQLSRRESRKKGVRNDQEQRKGYEGRQTMSCLELEMKQKSFCVIRMKPLTKTPRSSLKLHSHSFFFFFNVRSMIVSEKEGRNVDPDRKRCECHANHL